jgi:hypothetical protein
MAKIKSADLCELAFIDKYDRLCLIGVTTRFPVPSLPLFVRQLMIAARIVDIQPVDTISVCISMATPSGIVAAPNEADGFDVSVVGEYILITLRDVPLHEEGVHRFEVSLADSEPVTLEVLVRLVSKPRDAGIHGGDTSITAFEQASRLLRDVN